MQQLEPMPVAIDKRTIADCEGQARQTALAQASEQEPRDIVKELILLGRSLRAQEEAKRIRARKRNKAARRQRKINRRRS